MLIAPGTPVITADQIVRVVGRTGMRAEPWQDVRPGAAEADFWQRRGRTVMTALSGAFLLFGFLAHLADAGLLAALGFEGAGLAAQVSTLALIFYVSGIATGGWFIAPRAWISVKRLRPDMNLLMTIAVFGAAAIGEWFEAAVVTFLFALSLALESWSIGRARRAVEALIQSGGPQRHVGWAFRVDVVRRDDLMFRFLDGDELAELVRLGNLPLANGLGVRFEDAQYFVDDVRITTQEARPGLVDDTLHERPQLLQPILCALQQRVYLRTARPHPLAQPAEPSSLCHAARHAWSPSAFYNS
jgi:hypothetical protein